MAPTELLGYAAAALVLAAFSVRSIVVLRSVALASNVLFIAYAVCAHLPPVLALHMALLPVNVWRLCEARGVRGGREKRAPRIRAHGNQARQLR